MMRDAGVRQQLTRLESDSRRGSRGVGERGSGQCTVRACVLS